MSNSPDTRASLLLRLSPRPSPMSPDSPDSPDSPFSPLSPDSTVVWPVQPAYDQLEVELEKVTLSEANVLLLDYAQYKLGDDVHWSKPTEVLRIDNEIRTYLFLSGWINY